MALRPEDLQATFCATLVDEWARDGVADAVVCPGSRSTPLAMALLAHDGIAVHVHHDERSAAFMAVGLALGTDEPVIVLTTSGTAAAELHPAVVEADLAGVPLLVCTADRPPELIDVAAPQAIDQTHLFGRSVRWFHAPGVADEAAAPRWRAVAARAYAEATGSRPGPVHLDLAFREPLVGAADALPLGRSGGGAWVWRPPSTAPVAPVISVVDDLAGRRGVIVAGAGSGPGPDVERLAEALGWPVFAAPQADVWGRSVVVPAVDALLRSSLDLVPDVVLHLGSSLASRVAGEWLAASGAPAIIAAGEGSWVDPQGIATLIVPLAPASLLEAWSAELVRVEPVDGGAWAARWHELGGAAAAAVTSALEAELAVTEPLIARQVVDAVPADGVLVASSSMPIRDLEWYAYPARPVEVHANRGANGIDGVVSTAVGLALAGDRRPTVLLIGDVAFLHDSNGLLGAAGRGIDLVVVVVDNDGGGIFSFLPQADAVDPATFETLFGTPHGLDLVALAAAYGVQAHRAEDVGSAIGAGIARGGVHVVVVGSDRAANRAVHQRLNAAVAETVAATR